MTRRMSDASDRWWLENHNVSKRSSWLQSTLSDLETKAKAMITLIEEDADSFAERAEMYYKKRPELISLVEDFYKTHRLLAERYDHYARSDHGATTRLPKPVFIASQKSDTCSESCESEVEDPDQEKEKEEVLKLKEETVRLREENRIQKEYLDQEKEKREFLKLKEQMLKLREENKIKEEELIQEKKNDEILKLKEEIERLREENRIQKDDKKEVSKLKDEIEILREENKILKEDLKQEKKKEEVLKLKNEIEWLRDKNKIQKEELEQKDEEKRDVIRQLSKAFELIKDENLDLKKDFAVLLKRNQRRICWESWYETTSIAGGNRNSV